ncbi:MAG: hypothetical protein ABSF24_12800 [Candidatus Bathyarchaeia archaeon]|jgi:hypothetical protein
MAASFSRWKRWADRDTIAGIYFPGVYALAISAADISGKPFTWRREIVYIGMTNSKGGLRSRLQQFDNTIHHKEGHGGARRFLTKYPDPVCLAKHLFVSVCSQGRKLSWDNPLDLRLMGRVARQEYECMATYYDEFGQLPEFNDKGRSPKEPW